MQCSVKEAGVICTGIALTMVGIKGFCKKHKQNGIDAALKTRHNGSSFDIHNMFKDEFKYHGKLDRALKSVKHIKRDPTHPNYKSETL